MEGVSQKAAIQNTFSSVRSFSFAEKKNPITEEVLNNQFLDAVLDFKSSLKEKTQEIREVNDKMERLTWLNDLDEECLMITNDLISAAKDLHSSLMRQHVSMNSLQKKGIAKEEISNFKSAIDELKEAYSDLESVFFFLPEMPEFVETTKQLSLIK